MERAIADGNFHLFHAALTLRGFPLSSPSSRIFRQVQADGGEFRFRYELTGATSSGAGCTNPTGNVVSVVLPIVLCPTVDSWEHAQAGYTITGGTVTATNKTKGSGVFILTATRRFVRRAAGLDDLVSRLTYPVVNRCVDRKEPQQRLPTP
jgi:hypothetical protein